MKKYIFLISLMFCSFWSMAQVGVADLIQVSGGSFTMGNSSYARESPTKTITVSPFLMGRYTVTNAQFAQFVNAYGSTTVKVGEFAGKPMFVSDSWGIINNGGVWTPATGYEQFPMIKVTWYGALEFCKSVGGRLPTEAEWEYAAKGGSPQQSYTFSGSSTATTVAWFYDNSGQINKAVGTKAANSLGLYDMSGNVYQWCSDWFGHYGDFSASGDINPAGPATGASRVIRGGYRSLGSGDLHLTNRESVSPDDTYNFVGFRVVKDSLSSGVTNHDDILRVFPNPVKYFLNIASTSDVSRIQIYDAQGHVIRDVNGNTKSIATNDFVSGMYVIKIQTDSKVLIKKFEVRH